MTIREAIEIANKNAGIKKATIANLQEAQAFEESFRFDDYPINIILPFTSNGNTRNGIRRAIIPLQGWILTRVREQPEDYRSLKMEQEYLEPMRHLAAKFLKELYKTDIIDPEAVERGITDTIKPEYMVLNMLAFGVSYTVNLPVIQNVC